MTIGIYGIFDARDDTCLYVGQSKTIEERWQGHLNKLRLGKHLRSEFNDHFLEIERNENLLNFRILEECEDLDAIKNHLEMKWFNILMPKFYGKKPTLNGKWSHSEETKAKISRSIAELVIQRLGKDHIPGQLKRNDFNCESCNDDYTSVKLVSRFCSDACRIVSLKKTDDSKIADLYLSGLNAREVAEKLGITHPAVLHSLKSSGIQTRTRAESFHLRKARLASC